jgi:hypothetical protein
MGCTKLYSSYLRRKKFPYFVKARGIFSAECRGVGVVMDALISHFASGIFLASSNSQFLLQAFRRFLPLVFYMAMMCISQVCLGRGVCTLFQKGTTAYWSWSDGMEPNYLHMCRNLR